MERNPLRVGDQKKRSPMRREPREHVRVLVGGVVVEDGLDHHAWRYGSFDGRDDVARRSR